MQTVKKGEWLNPVGVSHSLEHVYSSLVVLFIFSLFSPLNIALVLIVVLFEGILHYLTDYTKVRFGSKDNTKPIFWHQFGADQLAHQLTYTLMVFILLYDKL
jgi:membrane-bound metal-dependent hydrolase YbcI (DUF457 family)